MRQKTTMMDHRPFTDKKTGLYPYSSLQINVPALIAQQIMLWGDNTIYEDDIYCPPHDLIHGREDEIHVTVLYGINSYHPEDITSILSKQKSFDVKLGCVSIFTSNVEFDVVKIEVVGPGLFHLNQLLKNNISNTPCYSNYNPHVTVAYVKKDTCNNLVGNSHFKNWRWVVNSLIFSSTNGQKTPIRINTLSPVFCS